MKKIKVNIIAFIIFISGFGASYSNQIIIGRADYEYQDIFQYWRTVSNDPSNYLRLATGIITEIKRNRNDPPMHDGDWCIWLNLTQAKDLTYNSLGHENSDGLIEVEIQADFPLQEHFQVGDLVKVYGWHVEDMGHCVTIAHEHEMPGNLKPATVFGGKTELHPIVYIQKGRIDDDFKLFSAQDGSNRFLTSRFSLNLFFPGWSIPLSPRRRLALFNHITQHSMHLLKESAVVDVGIGSMSGNQEICWNQSHSVIEATQSPGNVFISPKLKPFNQGCIKPLYFADFQSSREDLIQISISVQLRAPSDSEAKFLEANVSAQLSNPSAYPPFRENTWIYDETNDSGENVTTTLLNPANNSVSYVLKFSPALGFNRDAFSLDIMACTRRPDWSPGSSRSYNGLLPAEERVFGQSRFKLYFIRSNLTLNANKIRSESTISVGAGRGNIFFDEYRDGAIVSCVIGYSIEATIDSSYPEIINYPVQWHVMQLTTASGENINNPTLQPVPSDGTDLLTDSARIILEDPEHGTKLKVFFRNNQDDTDDFFRVEARNESEIVSSIVNRRLTLNDTDDLIIMRNHTKIKVFATLSTDLGEEILKSELLSVPSCVGGSGSRSTIREMWSEFEKLILAILKLEELGLISTTLPQTWPRELEREWQGVVGPLGSPSKWYTHLPEIGKYFADIYISIIKGKNVERSAVNELLKALILASKLPDIKRTNLPSKPDIIKIDKSLFEDIAHSYYKEDPSLPKEPHIFSMPLSQLTTDKKYLVHELVFGQDDNLSRASIRTLIRWSRLLIDSDMQLGIDYVVDKSLGTEGAEIALRRAKTIERILVSQGVNPNRIKTRGQLQKGIPDEGIVQIRIIQIKN